MTAKDYYTDIFIFLNTFGVYFKYSTGKTTQCRNKQQTPIF